MQIDRYNIDQLCKAIDEYCFIPFYTGLKELHSKYPYVKYASLIVGLGDAFLSTVQAVAGVFEATFKGTANLFIGMNAYLGALQICGAFWIMVGSVPTILVKTINISINFFKDPGKLLEHQLGKILKSQHST